MTILYVLLAIFLLGILITVHEFGHFIASRAVGIAVKEFSIGFGPKLLQWKSKKHDTLFTLRPIPMGGYCMFYGDTDDDPKGEQKNDPRNYVSAAVWKRMISVLSGPAMNLVLAFIVAVVLMAGYGLVATQSVVDSVDAGLPAATAGLMPGDVFLRVGDTDVDGGNVSAVSAAIGAHADGEPFTVTVLRDGAEQTLTVTPFYDTDESRYRIGVVIATGGYQRLSAGECLSSAWRACVNASTAILDALGKLVTTGEGLNQTSGPVGVVQLVAQQTQQGGLEVFLQLMVVISINLGLVNLLPIPGLDGSRFVFMLIEAVRHKPVSQRIEATVHMCGYVLLLGLMLLFTFKDVGRLFG